MIKNEAQRPVLRFFCKSIIKNYKRRKKYFTKLADTNYKKYLAKKDIFMYNYQL